LWIWREALLRQVRPRWSLACGLPDAHPAKAMTIAAKLILLIVTFMVGMAAGVKWQIGIVAARDLQAVQDNARVQILRADRADQAAERHEKTKTRVEIEYREIEKEVERVRIEYRDVACLAGDGLRVAQRAIAAANAAAGFPSPAVSAPARTD